MCQGTPTATWLTTPDGPPDQVLEALQRRIEEHPSGDRVIAAVELIMGMMHLCGSVLTLRELDSGISAMQTIQDLAFHLAETDDFWGRTTFPPRSPLLQGEPRLGVLFGRERGGGGDAPVSFRPCVQVHRQGTCQLLVQTQYRAHEQ
jgi:hypothetical protein